MKVASINVGLPSWQRYGYGEVLTGGAKRPVRSAVLGSDGFEPVGRHPDSISIADVNDVIFDRRHDPALVERLACLPEFAAGGRALFVRLLERLSSRGGAAL